jgi:hypothetical protein
VAAGVGIVTRDEFQQLNDAIEAARSGFGPQRAMRVTLECAHLRLMSAIATVMGIGSQTTCRICPIGDDGYPVTRTVVNIEETGVLHDSWRPTPARDTCADDPGADL